MDNAASYAGPEPSSFRAGLLTILFAAVVSVAWLAAPVVAGAQTTVYVDTAGSDSSGDGTAGNPWATITHALDNVADGSTVLVRAGTYNGRVRLRGRFASGVTVRSETPYQARIREQTQQVVTCFDCEGITLEGFDISHTGPGAAALVLQVQDADRNDGLPVGRMVLRNNIFHDSYNNDILKINNGATDVTVTGNMFYNQAGSDEHMDINSVTNVVIEDNVLFNDFSGSGRSDDNTSSFIVVKDSNGSSDGIVGSSNITIRRNVFLHYEGSSGQGFVRIGEDGTSNFEADTVLIENNLMLGNNTAQIRSPLQFQGVTNITARANTISGNMPAKEYGFRIVTAGANQDSDGIHIHNNIWTDPTGTMGDTFNRGSNTLNLTFDNNLFWNDGNSFPTSSESFVEVTDDAGRVVGDPLLPNPASATLPRWNQGSGQFADGSATIREVFEALVASFGVPGVGSAAFGAADAAEMPLDDILGQLRSEGGAPDVGAYETASCVGAPNGAPCDDGNLCTTNDQCTAGVCAGTNDDGAVCDDSNGCTTNDQCQGGSCAGTNDDGASCDDGDICTHTDVCSGGACTAQVSPRTGCRVADRGSLQLRENGDRDKLQWLWKGTGTVVSDFGDPVGGSPAYGLCLYDNDTGGYSAILGLKPEDAQDCAADRCWRAQGSNGFRYKSRSGAPDGVQQLKLKATSKTLLLLKAGRDSLSVPSLPLVQNTDLVAQLVLDGGACWETTFTAPAAKNVAPQFKDKF